MYLSLPNNFFVPVHYIEKHILDIENIILQECNSYNSLINRTSIRKNVIIGVSLPTQKIARWVRDKESMEEYAKSIGVTLKLENAEFDPVKQISQAEELISQGIDVLILLPLNTLVLSEIVEKAHKAGIKVISYEALVKNSDVDFFVGFDNVRIGQLQAKFLIEKVPKGRYIILNGIPDIGIKEGVLDYIKPMVDIRNIIIIADKVIKNWDPAVTFEVVKDVLIANKNNVDAILAPNDTLAGGAIDALREQGLAGKVVVTGGNADLAAIQRIIEGTQAMTIFKDSKKLAQTAIDAAVKLANNESLDVNKMIYNGKIYVTSILFTPILIDKNNIKEVIIDSGYLNAKDVYKRYW